MLNAKKLHKKKRQIKYLMSYILKAKGLTHEISGIYVLENVYVLENFIYYYHCLFL